MPFFFKGFASFLSLPLYVGFKADHGMKIDLSFGSSGSDGGGNSKSHSYDMVACSRPSFLFGGSSSSLSIKVYLFSAHLQSAGQTYSFLERRTPTIGFGNVELHASIIRQVPLAIVARGSLTRETGTTKRLDVESTIKACSIASTIQVRLAQ